VHYYYCAVYLTNKDEYKMLKTKITQLLSCYC